MALLTSRSRDLAYGRDNVRICPAPAEIAAHEFADLRVGVGMSFFEKSDRRHDLPGRAVAALKGVMTDERLLDRMQRPVPCKSFDRGHLTAVALSGQRQTRQNPLAVRQNRARTARSLIAALLRTDQAEVLAQRVEQGHTAV